MPVAVLPACRILVRNRIPRRYPETGWTMWIAFPRKWPVCEHPRVGGTFPRPAYCGASGEDRHMADRELEGQVAIVTGAAQGIGKCIADDGASVVLADIQHEKAAEV